MKIQTRVLKKALTQLKKQQKGYKGDFADTLCFRVKQVPNGDAQPVLIALDGDLFVALSAEVDEADEQVSFLISDLQKAIGGYPATTVLDIQFRGDKIKVNNASIDPAFYDGGDFANTLQYWDERALHFPVSKDEAKVIATVSKSASVDTARPNLCGPNLLLKDDEKVYVAATNGHYVHRVALDSDLAQWMKTSKVDDVNLVPNIPPNGLVTNLFYKPAQGDEKAVVHAVSYEDNYKNTYYAKLQETTVFPDIDQLLVSMSMHKTFNPIGLDLDLLKENLPIATRMAGRHNSVVIANTAGRDGRGPIYYLTTSVLTASDSGGLVPNFYVPVGSGECENNNGRFQWQFGFDGNYFKHMLDVTDVTDVEDIHVHINPPPAHGEKARDYDNSEITVRNGNSTFVLMGMRIGVTPISFPVA